MVFVGTHEGQLAVDLRKGWKACVVTSTLEALAVFLARKLQNGEAQLTKGPIFPTWSDNRGNGSALTKLLPTRYRASALLVKMAAHTKRRRLKTQVEWLPGALRMGLDAERALADARSRGTLPDRKEKKATQTLPGKPI